MHPSSPRALGRDVHHAAIAVADVAPDQDAAVIARGTIGTRHVDREHLIRTRHSKATPLVVVDEAGPWGSWRDRDLTQTGDLCGGVAP